MIVLQGYEAGWRGALLWGPCPTLLCVCVALCLCTALVWVCVHVQFSCVYMSSCRSLQLCVCGHVDVCGHVFVTPCVQLCVSTFKAVYYVCAYGCAVVVCLGVLPCVAM